jgi:tetratricopeptide (TPR) repeat protein
MFQPSFAFRRENQPKAAKQLRIIADNLDATCLLRLEKSGKDEAGNINNWVDSCSGVLVKEGFILTTSRYIETPDDCIGGQAIFFYENHETEAAKVGPVTVPLDPQALFYSCPVPGSDPSTGKEAPLDDAHLNFCAIGIDRSQLRPYVAPDEVGAEYLQSPSQSAPASADSARRKSKLAARDNLQESLTAFEEIIPLEIYLNNVDMSVEDPTPTPEEKQDIVVVEHLDGGKKLYHYDVIDKVGDFFFTYSPDRSPQTNDKSCGSPVFTTDGSLLGIVHKVGRTGVPHQVVRLNTIVAELRRYMKECRRECSKTAKRGTFEEAAKVMYVTVGLCPNPAGENVIQGLSQTAEVLENLTNPNELSEKLESPLQCHTQAIEWDRKNVDAYIARGLVLHMQTKFADAIRDFSSAIQLEPAEADYYYYRGHAFYDQGNLDAAITDYSSAIRMQPGEAVFYLNRGNALTDQNQLDGANKDYTVCTKLAPNDENAFFRRGNVLRMMGKLAAAISDYTTVLTLVPDHAAALFQRGMCYVAKAQIDVSKAYQLDPQPDYKRQLALFRRR